MVPDNVMNLLTMPMTSLNSVYCTRGIDIALSSPLRLTDLSGLVIVTVNISNAS